MIFRDIKFYFQKVGVTFLINPGFQAILLYRLGHWAYYHNRLINPFWYLYITLARFHRLFHKIELPPSAKIGANLYLPHPYGLVMAGGVMIGNNCTISAWSVLGHLRKDGNPKIGNNVYIGPHSCILGKIEIGDNSVIGACSLVIESVPAYGKVMGTVSKIKLSSEN